MRDFRALVRAQVTPLHLSSEREETVVEEYALYIEDVYASLLDDGLSEDAAWDELPRRIPSWPEWREQLLAADPNSRAVVGALARSASAERPCVGGRAPRRASVFATVALLPLAIGRDATVAMRALGRNRGPVLAAIASVGIALGVAGSAVSVATALYAWSPAVATPDRLVFVSRADASRTDDHQLTLDEFQELRRGARHTGVLGGVLGWRDSVRTVRARERTFTAIVAEVGGDFDELGLRPVIGRGFRADELGLAIGDAASPPVALLSYGCWRERFAADPSVLGEPLVVDGVAVTIVGVTPPAFTGLSVETAPAAVVSLAFNAGRPGYRRRDTDVTTLVRLGPAASAAQAAAQLQALWPQVFGAVGRGARTGNHSQAPTVVVTSARYGITDNGVGLRRGLGGPLRGLVALGMAAVLMAYINLAGLMLARAAARRSELELRIALGASRWAAARPLTLEGMLIGFGGGAIALGLMFWLTPLLVRGLVGERVITVPLLSTRPPLALTAATVFAAACIAAACAALPSLRLARFGQLVHLRGMSSRIRGEGLVPQRLLVVAQLCFAVMFCAAAIFFGRELYRLAAADPPFRVADMITLQAFPLAGDGSRIPDRAAYFGRLLERFAQVPGVLDTTFALPEPLAGRNSGDGRVSVVVGGTPLAAHAALVGPEFFRVMGISMLSGREFGWRDDTTAPPAVVVNVAFRDAFLRDADALGRGLSIPEFFYPLPDRLAVIGVANDAGLWDVRHPTVPTVYLPLLQSPVDDPFVILHTKPLQAPPPEVINHTLESLGHHFSLRTETLSGARDRALQMERLSAILAMILCSLNILLATIGVYALVAYAVERRTSEMGVRLALGATSSSIITLFMREALMLATIGICIGAPVAIAAVTAGARLLLGDTTLYPPAYILSAAIVFGVAAAASGVPAWRAAKLSPSTALSSS